MTTKQTSRPLSSDALPLVLQAAFEHPVPTVRAQVHAWLLNWVEDLGPRFDASTTRAVLTAARGTDIEPFTLSPRDLEIATIVARASFSARVGHQRVRVVSSETLGIHGGLVLTTNLRSYYVERAAWAQSRKTPWRVSFVAPGWLPGRRELGTRVKARCRLTNKGWELQLPVRCWGDRIDAQKLAASIEVHPLETPDGKGLRDRGLVVWGRDGHISLATTGPESLMRITAMAAKRQVLAFHSRFKTRVTRVLVQLESLDAEDARFAVLLTQTSRNTRQWAGFWSDVTLPLPFEYREAIARVFPMHDSWATPALLGTLL